MDNRINVNAFSSFVKIQISCNNTPPAQASSASRIYPYVGQYLIECLLRMYCMYAYVHSIETICISIVSVHMHIHECMNACVTVCVLHIRTYVHMYSICIHTYAFCSVLCIMQYSIMVHMYVPLHVCTYIHTYICMTYVCMYVRMYSMLAFVLLVANLRTYVCM